MKNHRFRVPNTDKCGLVEMRGGRMMELKWLERMVKPTLSATPEDVGQSTADMSDDDPRFDEPVVLANPKQTDQDS